jgi:hypothetical protein
MFRTIIFERLMSAARAETFAAQHGSSARRLEWNGVGFAALVADDLETLAVASASASASAASRAAKVGSPRISTILATLGLAQVALGVILLFAFCEGKGFVAFGTGNFNVWHDALFLLVKARAVDRTAFILFSLCASRAETKLPTVRCPFCEPKAQRSWRLKVSRCAGHAQTPKPLLSKAKFTAQSNGCTEKRRQETGDKKTE